ncbi:MAG: hypothetical protein M1828_007101 [Chrysothrix sp. TS-e1954]|nr:MAG: hypothetical protein M1828_007101 [Chrysothrix sp. TS-e1954]
MPLIDREALKESDRTWLSKLILRLLLTLCCLVAIGLIGWEVSKSISVSSNSNSEYYGSDADYFGGGSGDAWTFVALGLSVIWSFVSISILLIRKRPVHPGFNVAFDLLLSLGLAIAAAALSLNSAYAGYNDYYDGYGNSYTDESSITYDGQEAVNSNPQEPYKYSFGNGTTITRRPGGTNYLCPSFDSCAQQNSVLSLVGKLSTVERVGAGFVSTAALIQIVLFIWACVDTHKRNHSTSYEGRARLIADEMIREMRVRGELPPLSPNGQPTSGFYGPTAYQGAGGGYYHPQGPQPYQPYQQPGIAQPYPAPNSQYPPQQQQQQQQQGNRQLPTEYYGHPSFRGEQDMQQAEQEKAASQPPRSTYRPAPSGPQYHPLRVKDDDDDDLPGPAPRVSADQ